VLLDSMSSLQSKQCDEKEFQKMRRENCRDGRTRDEGKRALVQLAAPWALLTAEE